MFKCIHANDAFFNKQKLPTLVQESTTVLKRKKQKKGGNTMSVCLSFQNKRSLSTKEFIVIVFLFLLFKYGR